MEEYKSRIPFDQRLKESSLLMKKYPNRVPLYIDTPRKDLVLSKNKYLVEDDMTISALYAVLRKHLHVNSSEGIYLMINKQLMPCSVQVNEVYKQHADKDGLLYIQVLKEETFGST